jgi:glutamate--cysteine ligase
MPCRLPTDENIPLGVYGTSNVGRAKSVYRMGLGHRYGRRMQTIPASTTTGRCRAWAATTISADPQLPPQRLPAAVLFGASPVLDAPFVAGRDHGLQPLGEASMYLPHATSLRMGRLGYQSDAQASLNVSYNCLDSYANRCRRR